MNPIARAEVQRCEAALREAMLDSDVAELDRLIADDLLFTNHLGQLMTKQADLEAHRQGLIEIDSLDLIEQQIRLVDKLAIVSVQAHITGRFAGEPSDTRLRFTRVWQKVASDQSQIIAAQATAIV